MLAAAVPGRGEYLEADWEEQTRGMIYLVLHLSSINAINGLNLTVDQALRLRQLAREVEAVSAKIPDFKAIYRPDLAEVRDTYLEVRKYIITGREVPGELEKRVIKARGIESAVIRLSISKRNLARPGCLRCHTRPRLKDVRSDESIMSGVSRVSSPDFTGSRRETFLAHADSIFGRPGIVKLATLAAEVERVLSSNQADVLRTFACCLVPPKELSNPVRVGQAEGGEKEIEIFRAVRKAAKPLWPFAKAIGLKKLEPLLVIKYSGITEDKIKTICRRVGEIYEKARALSELDFELEKKVLAVELHKAMSLKQEPAKRHQGYLNAFFLLIPGSAEVYDNLIARTD